MSFGRNEIQGVFTVQPVQISMLSVTSFTDAIHIEKIGSSLEKKIKNTCL